MSFINGVAHTILTVSDFDKSVLFYTKLCEFFGLTKVFQAEMPDEEHRWLYFVGGRTAIGICSSDKKYEKEKFKQFRVGLHHICWRVKSKEDVETFQKFFKDNLINLGGKIVHECEEGPWAPGYYSFLFEDPDGIRLEINYVPGTGLLGLKEKKLFSKL